MSDAESASETPWSGTGYRGEARSSLLGSSEGQESASGRRGWTPEALMRRFRDWRDNTAWHHIWVGNGPLWWICRDCRAIRRSR